MPADIADNVFFGRGWGGRVAQENPVGETIGGKAAARRGVGGVVPVRERVGVSVSAWLGDGSCCGADGVGLDGTCNNGMAFKLSKAAAASKITSRGKR
jgi:hypothetical protein